MQGYVLRRLAGGLFVLWGVSLLVFIMVRLIPGDVVTALTEGQASRQQAAVLRHQLGIDRPAPRQYLSWLGNVLHADLGKSLFSGQAISSTFGKTLPVTLELTVLAALVALAIAVPIGILSATNQDTPIDYFARVFAILGVSLPDFLIGSLLLTWLVTSFGWAPSIVAVSLVKEPGRNLAQYILPALVLGYRLSATTMRMTRSSLLEVLREDYVRSAWAKGLTQRSVVVRHAMKNAAIPVVTVIGLQVSYLLAGSVIVETVFNLPGMGQLLVQAIRVRDYTTVQACVLLVGAVMVGMNLLVDLSYGWLDPRIRKRYA